MSENKITCTKPAEVSPAVQQMSTGTQALVGAGAVATAGVSMMNLSSPTALWAMANQLQLFMLLILTGVYLPVDVIEYITANKFMSFSMDFLPVDNLVFVKIPTGWFESDQDWNILGNIGISSGSTFNNNFNWILTIF